VAQKTATAELEQLDQALASLTIHQATIVQQLEALASEDVAPVQLNDNGEHSAQYEANEEGAQEVATTISAVAQNEQRPPSTKAKVLYTFQAQSEGEVSVFSGTIINLAEPEPNGDWCASSPDSPIERWRGEGGRDSLSPARGTCCCCCCCCRWLIEFNGQSGYVPQSYLSPLP
jgi:hypothetical protein